MTLQEFYTKGKEHLALLYEQRESEAILKRLVAYLPSYADTPFLLHQNNTLNAEEVAVLEVYLQQVAEGVPVQYVLGETSFYGLDFYVEKGILIPRQETEELVDWIVQREQQARQILDIGVGSGCITASLGKNLKNAHLTAFDISLEALDLARENCDRYGLRPTFLYGDILQWQQYGLDSYDVIVSNPPYVCESEKDQMHKNVLAHEPHLALFVPNDTPLLFYKAIADLGRKHLKENGVLYFEINEKFGKEVQELLENKEYRNVELRKDLNGKNRMLRAVK